MKVRALETGFIKHRIPKGTEWELPKGLRIGRWMEPLDDEAKKAKAAEDKRRGRNIEEEHVRLERLRKLAAGEPAALSKKQPQTFTEMTRAPQSSGPSGVGTKEVAT